MEIDFLQAPCKESSTKPVFGLCDDPPPAKNKAYISEDGHKKNTWIAQVLNKDEKSIHFYAIDHCIEISKPNEPKKEESRCDGLLVTESFYKFIELKDCKLSDRNWRKKGNQQLKTTISIFRENYPEIPTTTISAQLCNKKHSSSNILYQDSQDEFFQETGIILEIKRQITL